MIVIIGAYIPPKYRAAQNVAVLDKISEVTSQAKTRFKNPLILTGGDYNNRDHHMLIA